MTIACIRTSVMALVLVSAATGLYAQSQQDTLAIKTILDEEASSWNRGDAQTYSRHFAVDGTFTNILGMFFTGHRDFLERHEQIFKGVFRKTTLRQQVASLRFVGPDVAVVETLTWISGFSEGGPPPGTKLDAKGRLYTRLLQVMEKAPDGWKIVAYHNTDVKPGVAIPDMK